MTIPTNPEDIKKLEKLADRNIANGDWGDETKVLGAPGETIIPISPEERIIRLSSNKKLPSKKKEV